MRAVVSRSRSSPRCARPTSSCSRDALGLGDDVIVNPSGGALVANPVMVTGLARIGEAFRQVNEHGKQRALGHASSGPCLQQNLVCVLEAR